MAKQVGLFNLRGKIENKSFYKTAGVAETIIRGIPEGLSNRVKTAEEYTNTRLNNAEFKTANAIAAAAFRSVANRSKGMMRRFAIAEMTKRVLEDIKQATGTWGSRVPATELDVLMADILENYAKGGAYNGEFGEITVGALQNDGTVSVTIVISAELQNQWKALGVDGMMALASKALAGEFSTTEGPRLLTGSAISVWQPISFLGESDITITQSIDVSTPASVGMSPGGYGLAQNDPKHGFYGVVTILPFRQQGSSRYTMQEYCTYVAAPFGQIPE